MFRLPILVIVFLASAFLYGAPEESSDETLIPIDRLQQGLSKNYRSKPARTLRDAFKLLGEERFQKALALSSKIEKNETYSDYALWISASALEGLSEEFIESKNYPNALAAAKKALNLLLQIELKNPYSPMIKSLPKELADAEILIGEIYWATKKWQLSAQTYEKAFQRLQMQNQLLLLGGDDLAHYAESCKKRQGPMCMSWIQRFASVFYRKSGELKAILNFFPNLPDRAKVSRVAAKTTVTYKAPDLDQVALDAAMKAYFDNKFGLSVKSFRQFLDDFPRSAHRFRARYWLAQSLSHEQEHGKAQRMYEELQQDSPLTYYGLLSSNGSGKSLESSIEGTLPVGSESDPALQPREILRLQRARSFIAEGALDLATMELKDFRPRDDLSSQFLVYLTMLNYKAKNYLGCFNILGELFQRGYGGVLSSYGLRMIFPVDYLKVIEKAADDNNLDPILVLSLIKQESAFDSEANSSSGAMGLMQLMPATAVDTSPEVSMNDLLEPEPNIKVGTKYLRKLLTRFNGNIVLALAGYNAGPNAADRWIKDASASKRGMLEFIESIPYRETREYVGAIIRNYYWYSRQLGGAFPKSLNYFWNVYGPPEIPVKLPNDSPIKPQNENA